MGATYTRQSTFTDGDVIDSDLFNDEFDQLLAAFASSTGHTHDGTAGEGGPITGLITDGVVFGTNTGDITLTWNAGTNDGLITWKEDEDYFEFNDDLLIATNEKIQFRDTAIHISSGADGHLDLVADTEIHIAATTINMDGLVDISGNLSVGGNLDVTGTFDLSDSNFTNAGDIQLDSISGDGDTNTSITFSGSDVITVANAGTNQVTFNDGSISPVTDSDVDLGTNSLRFKDVFIDSATVTGEVAAASLDISGNIDVDGTTNLDVVDIDGAVDMASTLAVAGVLTGASLDISGDIDIDGTANLDIVDIDGAVDMATTLTVGGEITAASLDISGNVDIDGTLETDALSINSTAVTSTAAELNILDGVTSTAAELNILDGVTASAADINLIDGITNGTVIASKAIVTDANIDITGGRNITISGELDAATLDISGNADIDGTLETDSLSINGTAVTSTAAELNILDGVTATATELNLIDGVTATTAELNILDGVTSTANELNTLDGVTSTTAELNILDGVTSTTAELNILDGVTSAAAELNILDVDNTTLGDLAEISTVANDDVFLAVDTSGGGLKKLTRSTIVSGLATSSGLSNVVEDTTPQLGGNLDTNSHNIIIDDAHFIGDESGNEQIVFQTTGSAVNQFEITNAASGNPPQLAATGGDTNIDLNLLAKATGHVTVLGNSNSGAIQFNCENNTHGQIVIAQPHSANVTNTMLLPAGANSTLVSLVSTDTLTNKTLTSPKINEDVAVTSTATELNLLDGVTSTTAELNILDGVTSTASELNILDGVTSTAAELNILDGVTSTAAELNILDGVTSTAAELNALDGITAVVGELNSLDIGSTAVGTAVASKAVILDSNKDYTGMRNFTITGNLVVGGTTTVVDTVTMNAENAVVFEGATADGNETTLTIVDPTADRTINLPNQSGTVPVLAAASNTAVTSTPEELNILDGVTSTAAELNILDGVTSTAAELNILDGVTSTAAELNILDGVTSTAAELNIMDGVTTTAAEINLIDGGTARGTTAVADGDGILINDAGTMRMTTVQTVSAYMAAESVGGGNIVTTGALNSGTITSGFGNINTGSSTITTTGAVATGAITAGGILKTDDTTAATSTTDGSLQTDGGLSVAADAVIGDDLFMLSDAAVVTFGADKDVTLTHVADTGLLLNAAMVVQFRDSAINIGSPADGDLDINADDEIELNSTLIDINGNVDISGTTVSAGKITADAGIDIDNFNIDGTTIALSSGNMTLDAAGEINIDAGGGNITILDDGTGIAYLANSSSNFVIQSAVSDKDLLFKGNDGGSTITALTLDMSAAGAATFNNDVTAFSDERLKSNITTIPDALSKVTEMRGVHYIRDATGQDSTGVIAQEMQKIAPELVRTADDEMGTLSVKYGNITGYLIEAIKELKAEIEELKAR